MPEECTFVHSVKESKMFSPIFENFPFEKMGNGYCSCKERFLLGGHAKTELLSLRYVDWK
jgi:hypothetical protein